MLPSSQNRDASLIVIVVGTVSANEPTYVTRSDFRVGLYCFSSAQISKNFETRVSGGEADRAHRATHKCRLLRPSFPTRRDIDAVAENAPSLTITSPTLIPMPKYIGGDSGPRSCAPCLLCRDGAGHRIEDTREFPQERCRRRYSLCARDARRLARPGRLDGPKGAPSRRSPSLGRSGGKRVRRLSRLSPVYGLRWSDRVWRAPWRPRPDRRARCPLAAAELPAPVTDANGQFQPERQ